MTAYRLRYAALPVLLGALAFLPSPCLAAGLTTAEFAPNAQAEVAVSAPEEKCLPKRIYSQSEELYEVPSRLDIKRFPHDEEVSPDRGAAFVRHGCMYSIQIGQPGKIGDLWEMLFYGPGQVFFDGYWHPTESPPSIGFIQRAPLLKDRTGRDQLFVFNVACATDVCLSSLNIYAFGKPFQDALVLALSDPGRMKYEVSANGLLTVHGCMGPANVTHVLPNLCTVAASVSLRYDPEVRQFAIQDPNPDSIRFYKVLLEPRPALLMMPTLYTHG